VDTYHKFLHCLKVKVKNKTRVEGSICNEEFITNHSGDEQLLSVCNVRGRALGSIQTRFLTSEKLKVATNYILLNCKKVQLYIQQFSNDLRSHTPRILELEIEKKIENGFAGCFKKYVSYLSFICFSNMFTDRFRTYVSHSIS
jgi:hypothetical protein